MIGNKYEQCQDGNIVEWFSLSVYPLEMNHLIKALKSYSADKGLSFESRSKVCDMAHKLAAVYDSDPMKIETDPVWEGGDQVESDQ